MIIDNQAIIGSSNYNYRSFDLDLELDILVKNPSTIAKLKKYWEQDLKSAKAITELHPLRWRKFLKWLNVIKINS